MVTVDPVRFKFRNDPYRDTALRYCGEIQFANIYDRLKKSFFTCVGYAGHIGEIIRPFVPFPAQHVGYGIALTYAFADGIDKTSKEYHV